jgi:hypothetical protein
MRGVILFVFVCMASLISHSPSFGQGIYLDSESTFLSKTQLIGLSFDGHNSAIVRQAARQGFELSTGKTADVARWYAPRFPNITAVFSTELGRGAALIWGGSLGEAGVKYTLSPSAVLGLSLRQSLGPRSAVHLQIYGQFGGALHETECIGDYGALGGLQKVNCRLAASVLPPDQTLGYLWNQPPSLQTTVKLTYMFRF